MDFPIGEIPRKPGFFVRKSPGRTKYCLGKRRCPRTRGWPLRPNCPTCGANPPLPCSADGIVLPFGSANSDSISCSHFTNSDLVSCGAFGKFRLNFVQGPLPFSVKFRLTFVHSVSEFRLRFVQGSPSLLPRIPIRFCALFLQNPTWFRAALSGIPTHFRAGAPTDAALSGAISPGNSGRIFLHFVAVPPGKFPFLVIFCPFSNSSANGASGACLT